MKTLIFIICIFVFGSVALHAQMLKKFNGNIMLSDPWKQEGKANYSYKEDGAKQVLQGKYTLLYKGKEAHNGFMQNVTGTYKDGLRDGKWVFVATFTDWKHGEENNYKTGTSTLSLNYKSGQPEGTWTYSSSFKIRQKNDQPGKPGFTAYSKITKENIKITFVNGNVSSFSYEIPNVDPKDVYKIGFSFDEAGFIQGITKQAANVKSGEVWYHGLDKPATDEIKILDKFLYYLNNSKDSLSYLSYTYKTSKFAGNAILNASVNSENTEFLLSKIYNTFFLWNDVPGDLSYSSINSKSNMLLNVMFNGFLVREKMEQSAKEKVLPAELADQFTKINTLLQKLNNTLSDPKITKCTENKDAAIPCEAYKRYNDSLLIMKQAVNDLVAFYKGTGTVKTYTEVLENISFFKNISEQDFFNFSTLKLTSFEKNIMLVIDELEGYFKKFEFEKAVKEGTEFVVQKNYDAAKKAFQRAQFMNPDNPLPKAKLDEIKNLEMIADAEAQRMKIFNYLVDNFRKIPASYKYGEERKNVYGAYVILKDYYLTGIDNPAYDSFKKLEICNEAVKLVEKMNELLPKNTDDLEKQLKKIKDPAEIKRILGL